MSEQQQKPQESEKSTTGLVSSSKPKQTTSDIFVPSFDRFPPPPSPPDDDSDEKKEVKTVSTKSSAKAISIVDDLVSNDVNIFDEDIFSIKPKTVKEQQKNMNEESIFDDPLNLFSK